MALVVAKQGGKGVDKHPQRPLTFNISDLFGQLRHLANYDKIELQKISHDVISVT